MTTTTANILASIPGEYISAALRTLPNAATAMQETQETSLDVPDKGTVRFTCRRFFHKKNKSSYWFWAAEKAVAAE
jgi:hypothetical protein